ncbi:MAG: hypothetical protein ACAH59_00595 [Pseudobdellovibrionaceae bacterium]
MRTKMNFFFTILLILASGSVQAADRSLEIFLRNFHQDPDKMINLLPPQIIDGQVVYRGFLNDETLNRQLIEEKSALREEVVSKAQFSITPLTHMGNEDNPSTLVDNGVVITNIFELDKRGLMKAKLPHELWSDTYWPIYKGLLAFRYADGIAESTDWAANYGNYLMNGVSTDALSPAEKYDLLVGDSSMTLTNYSWNVGRRYYEQHGRVPTWMGICHGWSAATHMEAKIPYGSIVLKSPNGTPIRFFQSDVKGLNSMLWGKASPPTKFLGFRCDHTPPRDGQGRVVDDNCYDTNPATFYLTLANQLGMNNRSFVMDATFDSEVWNFSVISYKATYFNPQTFKQTDNLKQAVTPIGQYTIDKFKQHRAPGTAFVVGVTMDVTYMNENSPSHKVQTKPATKTQRYVSDLELDANYNVIGGEWYSRAHPDFIWSYAPGTQAYAPGDADINADEWVITDPVPSTWTAAAQKSSSSGAPLYSVIKKIVESAPTREMYEASGEIE